MRIAILLEKITATVFSITCKLCFLNSLSCGCFVSFHSCSRFQRVFLAHTHNYSETVFVSNARAILSGANSIVVPFFLWFDNVSKLFYTVCFHLPEIICLMIFFYMPLAIAPFPSSVHQNPTQPRSFVSGC